MPFFRKKPITIEAFQVPAEGDFCSDAMVAFLIDEDITAEPDGSLGVHTLEGLMLAKPGDWIIRGIAGEFYPCKNEIFHNTYEPAKEPFTGYAAYIPQDETSQIEVMKEALMAVQWTARAPGWCPLCDGTPSTDHKDDCLIGKALSYPGPSGLTRKD